MKRLSNIRLSAGDLPFRKIPSFLQLSYLGRPLVIRAIEMRLAEPAVVLDRLIPAAENTMAGCIEFIANRCCSYIDVEQVRKCKVVPATFFGEEWSIGMETAWQASGAGMLAALATKSSHAHGCYYSVFGACVHLHATMYISLCDLGHVQRAS